MMRNNQVERNKNIYSAYLVQLAKGYKRYTIIDNLSEQIWDGQMLSPQGINSVIQKMMYYNGNEPEYTMLQVSGLVVRLDNLIEATTRLRLDFDKMQKEIKNALQSH